MKGAPAHVRHRIGLTTKHYNARQVANPCPAADEGLS